MAGRTKSKSGPFDSAKVIAPQALANLLATSGIVTPRQKSYTLYAHSFISNASSAMQSQIHQFGQRLDDPATPPPSAAAAQIPLFHAACLFAAGITVAHWLFLRPSLLLIALGFLAILCCVAAFCAQRIVWLPLAALWCLLGAWCAQMEPGPAPAPILAALSDGLLRTVEGTVVEAGPVRSEIEQNLDDASAGRRPSQRIDLRVSTLEIVTDEADVQSPTEGSVRLTIRWPLPEIPAASNRPIPQPFHCGDRLRVTVRLLRPEVYRDPGVWNRQDALLDQGITSTAAVNIEQVALQGRSSAAFLACRLNSWQHIATARLLALPTAMRHFPAPLRLTPDDAVMLSAMIAGDRTYLTPALRVGFERTGSFHMLVVSGFHLAIVAAFVFWLTRLLHLPRIPATLLTIAASFAYALFTGFATPVQRSLWMVTLYLLARLVYRERIPLNTIGFAALCLLVVSPRSLFDASLQMTLLAVVAIAGIAAPLLKNTIHPYVNATRDLRLTAIDASLAPKLASFRETLRVFSGAFATTPFERFAARAIPFSVRFVFRVVELLVVSCVVELAMTLPMALYSSSCRCSFFSCLPRSSPCSPPWPGPPQQRIQPFSSPSRSTSEPGSCICSAPSLSAISASPRRSSGNRPCSARCSPQPSCWLVVRAGSGAQPAPP
jgi:competence protein ComEC